MKRITFLLFFLILISGVHHLAVASDAFKDFYRHARLDVFAPNTIKNPRFSAHRGSQAYGPENSIIAFEAAGRLGVWAIETDFRITRDSQVVCMHDATLERTTTGQGKVTDYTLDELRRFQIKEVNSTVIPNKSYSITTFSPSDKRIPLMDEYFDICAHYGCVPFIELKEDNGIIALMLASIKRHHLEGSCIISSSDITLLGKVRKAGCRELVHLINAKVTALPQLLKMGNAALAFNIKDMDKNIKGKYIYGKKNPSTPRQLVSMCHKLGLRVCFRAADTPEAARKALSAKVDYLPTNTMWPARMKE